MQYWGITLRTLLYSVRETCLIAELRRSEGPPSGAPYSCERKGNPWVDFLMITMASGIARGRVRTTTTTTESHSMAAILQKRGWQRHKALVYCVLLWYWTTMPRSIDTCQYRVSPDQYHVAILRAQLYSLSRSHVFFFEVDRWPSAGFSAWIASSCEVNVLRQGRIKRIKRNLRTVPTFVSAHTFCASRKTRFKRALVLTMTQSPTLLMKAKLSHCDQKKFNEPVLKPGTPE